MGKINVKVAGIMYFNDFEAFIEYSNDVSDIYQNSAEYNPNKNRKILIVFDDMIADIIINEKLNPILAELFIRGRKLNNSLVFNTQSYFVIPKNIRLNSTYYFIMKVTNKRELQQIAFNNSSDIDFQDFMNLYKNPLQNYAFFSYCTFILSNNPSRLIIFF